MTELNKKRIPIGKYKNEHELVGKIRQMLGSSCTCAITVWEEEKRVMITLGAECSVHNSEIGG